MLSLVRQKNQVPDNHQSGFTLIEVMVALAIFVIGIIGCYQLQLRSTHTNALANHVGTAATWATYAVEQLLAKTYDDSDLDDDGTGGAGVAGLDDTEGNADSVLYIRPNGSTGTTAAAGDLYSVSWNIAEGTGTGLGVLAGTKQIRVIVIKKGGIGKGTLYTHDYFKTPATL